MLIVIINIVCKLVSGKFIIFLQLIIILWKRCGFSIANRQTTKEHLPYWDRGPRKQYSQTCLLVEWPVLAVDINKHTNLALFGWSKSTTNSSLPFRTILTCDIPMFCIAVMKGRRYTHLSQPASQWRCNEVVIFLSKHVPITSAHQCRCSNLCFVFIP